MRMVAKGKSLQECKEIVDGKILRGWQPLTDIKYDDSFVGGRWVCVLEKPDQLGKVKSKFNQYMGM